MTRSIGLDLVEIASVSAAACRADRRYVARVYTEAEQDACLAADGIDPARLARHFAVKEATLKALAWDDRPFSWHDVELAGGELRLRGAPADRAAELRLRTWSVTTACAGGYASAVVLATTGDDA